MTNTITLTINGTAHTVTVDPDTPLLYVLRNDCALYSPKYGCGLEQCGACKVLVNGEAVPTCQLPVRDVVGKEIISLEGLSEGDTLHPMQQAFLDEQAAQCGFCTAGMITASVALCQNVDNPTDEDIKNGLQRHLCRCGVYDRVRRAINNYFGRSADAPKYSVVEMPPLPQDQSQDADLPRTIQMQPNLDAWVNVGTDGTITVCSGKVELGQGIKTALAQIAAEELDVPVSRINVITGDTTATPNEGGTTGSMSIEMSGASLRVASAEARHIMLTMAFEDLEAKSSLEDLIVENGIITDPETGRSTSYQALMGGKRFGHTITGKFAPKDAQNYQIVGKAYPRTDLLPKVTGQPAYVQDMNLPDMLHARVVRPPHYHARIATFDLEALHAIEGVTDVIHDGSFVALVAVTEAHAVAALSQSDKYITWRDTAQLPEQEMLYDDLMSKPATSNLIVDGAGTDEPIPDIETPAEAAQTLTASYRRPYHMHASLGTSAAVALWQNNQLTVWSHSQSVFTLRDSLAQVLDLPVEQIRVIHREGAGCYGHNGADDVALDAALIAMQLPERPISLTWMREQEHSWEPYGSAMAMETQASLDNEGSIISWHYDVYSYGHSTRPRGDGDTSGLLAAWHLEKPFEPQQPRAFGAYHFGAQRNADPLYDFPHKRIVRHEVADSPLRVSALRSLGAYANVFAIESFMDELANAAKSDPLAFRLRHLTDERAMAVLEAVADKAHWRTRNDNKPDNVGWGIAFAQYKNRQTYAAVIVRVHVNPTTGKIRVTHGYIAADAGLIINADGLSNQLEGGFVQALSWTLHEQVTYMPDGITSQDWESYPILRFPNAPIVETVLLNRRDQRSLGAGEATQNPTPAAIANAVYDAIGVRLRDIPFTPDKVKQYLVSE